MKVYSDPTHYDPGRRFFLNDVAKALWNDRTPEERERVYGAWVRGFQSVLAVQDADVVLLTMKWNDYVDRDLEDLAWREIEAAGRQGKKVVAFSLGDSPAGLAHPGVALFEPGGYRSAVGLAYHSGFPFFLKDYLQVYCGGELQVRPKPAIPVVGFCGQADSHPLRSSVRVLRNHFLKMKYRLGKSKWEPAPFETASFRGRVLRHFEGQAYLKTNFVKRHQYHAGNDKDKGDFSSQKLAFVHNILGSDYTVCARGGGNFSVRFYETLALGRIPVFIDTDCLLPFEDKIPYRRLFPRVEMKDLPRAAEIVAGFHARLSDRDFRDLQAACRELWERHFTPDGFYADLKEKIDELC